VLKPTSPGAKLTSLDEAGARGIAGVVAVVRDGSFAGVVAETESAAEAGLAALCKGAAWSAGEALPDETNLAAWLKSQPAETTTVDERKAPAPAKVARTIRRQYTRPYIAHASMAPSCAIAQWTGADKVPDKVHVWSHCQGVYNLRTDLGARLRTAAREHRRGTRRGSRLLRPQRRRRRGVRRRAAGARGRRTPGAGALVARG
jgi:hypothetical protein